MQKLISLSISTLMVFTLAFTFSFNLFPPDASAASQNVAAGKTLTSNATVTNKPLATDGITTNSNSFAEAATGLKYIQIDFGASYNINKVNLWHYYADGRSYKDVIVRLSNSSTFGTGTTTVFNNDTNNSAALGTGTDAEYAETSAGKAITFAPVNARYLRIYSNGSSANAYNHYVEVQAWTVDSAYRQNNITYTNPEWVMTPQTNTFIQNVLTNMQTYKIKYQMIDVGFFDRVAGTATYEDTVGGAVDGTFDSAAYSQLANWVTKSRAYDPTMKLIGSINGNSFLHVQTVPYTDNNGVLHTPTISKATMHDRIAAKAAELVNTYGLDGINLDFEPLGPGARSSDYRLLIQKVRNAIGPTKHLSICGNPFSLYMPDSELTQFGALLNMIVFMDYDTGDTSGTNPYPANPYTTDAASYQLAIKDNVKRISNALSTTNCELLPLGQGVSRLTQWHQPYENALNHSIAVNNAISEGAKVAGSGVWWFEGAMNDATETQNFITYWINGTP
ncbi:glycosyl hydrolase family 18 protein [Paenibacillus sp. HWE-109]|uniref:galactose-binding domain-containing protein n=1 Tax=Paenibacillus sp. HWE-109 TaxID=1306526 RepID=UPI001EDDFEEE|nr:glycosyl hydrolase family 18 protein [Paenibacillus sp. HWE-109]UKS25701.1 glycosyl hydrolase family 18 protein [Paenibacillus sp. HWE-109]